MATMHILLVVGADGAPFARELGSLLGSGDELTVVAPTVRGHVAAGLQASPDLDGLLAPAVGPTYAVADALESIGYTPHWQRASDQAVAVRLVRTELVTTGTAFTDATVAVAVRAGLPYRLLPMCEGRAEFRVVVGSDAPRAIHVDEYLDDPAAHEATQLLLIADQIAVSPAVPQALLDCDVLVLGPSSRTLAIDPVLRTPGFLDRVDDDLPVLVVEHQDTAPAELVRVAGLRQADPGRPEPVAADAGAVLDRARRVGA
jgi:LPPG:FO 2-phospho-L-lactate transferase